MYKPRYKYFTTNNGNLIERIMNSDNFTPYEYMSLRYACCESISKVDSALGEEYFVDLCNMRRNYLKQLVKNYQRCINYLDKRCFKGE